MDVKFKFAHPFQDGGHFFETNFICTVYADHRIKVRINLDTAPSFQRTF